MDQDELRWSENEIEVPKEDEVDVEKTEQLAE